MVGENDPITMATAASVPPVNNMAAPTTDAAGTPVSGTPAGYESQSRRESEASLQAPPKMMPPSSMPPPLMMAPPSMPTQASQPPTPVTPPTAMAPTPNYFADIKKPEPNHVSPPPKITKEPPSNEAPKKNDKKEENKKIPKSSSGIMGWVAGKFGILPSNQAHLPDDKDNSIVWDDVKKKWVDKNATEDEVRIFFRQSIIFTFDFLFT